MTQNQRAFTTDFENKGLIYKFIFKGT